MYALWEEECELAVNQKGEKRSKLFDHVKETLAISFNVKELEKEMAYCINNAELDEDIKGPMDTLDERIVEDYSSNIKSLDKGFKIKFKHEAEYATKSAR